MVSRTPRAVRTEPAQYALPLDTAPMEAQLATQLPAERGKWQYEPKWDGFRCLAFKAGSQVELRAKSGKSLTRFFPEVQAMLQALPARQLVLDGELLIQSQERGGFAALQMRLHPAASRIARLARQTPARLMAFDLLVEATGRVLIEQPLRSRRALLQEWFDATALPAGLALSACTTRLSVARGWLARSGSSTIDGVVAKRLDEPYRPGERAMVKVKPLRTADCVVGGFRYRSHAHEVGSLLLGLYDADGRLNHVGFTSTLSEAERPALTRRLQTLRASPGFTGNAPGAPSRWSGQRRTQWEPLRPELVVEVCFDRVTGGRFRHGTRLLRWRPDKAPRQCTLTQLADPVPPARTASEAR